MAEYADLMEEACQSNAKTFFAGEAHFRADAGLRGKWVLRGEPALVDSSSPRYGERKPATTRRCAWRPARWNGWMLRQAQQDGNSNSETSAAFLGRLRESHGGRLNVIWDNAPAHCGEAVREYLRTPGLRPEAGAPRFHEGRLCRATVQTSMPTRRSGAGRERRPPGTCAWGAKPWCRRKSATSWRGWPGGKRRSSAAAAPSCNQGLKGYCKTPSPTASHMHIPPWLWFRSSVIPISFCYKCHQAGRDLQRCGLLRLLAYLNTSECLPAEGWSGSGDGRESGLPIMSRGRRGR